jgi:hypothetical protein
MPDVPWIQWRVENMEELDRFLEEFVVDIRRVPGDQVVIRTPELNSEIQLSPGDCLVMLPHQGRWRLGVVRAPASVPIREADGIKDHNNKRFLDPADKRVTYGLIK